MPAIPEGRWASFGGGTSVVGGVDPDAGPHGAAIALDLGRLRHCEVDARR